MSTEKDPTTITAPVPWAPGHTVTGPAEYVNRYLNEVQLQRVARTQWPADNLRAMEALADLFPSMRGKPGTKPWDVHALVRWLNTSGEPTSGSRHAAMFLLSVWNDTDWTTFGLKVPKRDKMFRRIGRFDFRDAWAAWDDDHRKAALTWFLNPFWP